MINSKLSNNIVSSNKNSNKNSKMNMNMNIDSNSNSNRNIESNSYNRFSKPEYNRIMNYSHLNMNMNDSN